MEKVVFVDDSTTMLLLAANAVDGLVQASKIDLIQYSDSVQLIDDVESGALIYDLLITDINMPVMNGFELVEKLKQYDWIDAPCIALTTEGASDKMDLIRQTGFKGWIIKPFKPKDLVSIITKVLKL